MVGVTFVLASGGQVWAMNSLAVRGRTITIQDIDTGLLYRFNTFNRGLIATRKGRRPPAKLWRWHIDTVDGQPYTDWRKLIARARAATRGTADHGA